MIKFLTLPCRIVKPGAEEERNSKDSEHQLPNRDFHFRLIFRGNISTHAVTTSWKVVSRMYQLIWFRLKGAVNFPQCWGHRDSSCCCISALRLLLRRSHGRKWCSSCSNLVPHWLLTNYQPDRYLGPMNNFPWLWPIFPICQLQSKGIECHPWKAHIRWFKKSTLGLQHIYKHGKMIGRNEDGTNIQVLVLFFCKEKPLWLDCKTAVSSIQ